MIFKEHQSISQRMEHLVMQLCARSVFLQQFTLKFAANVIVS